MTGLLRSNGSVQKQDRVYPRSFDFLYLEMVSLVSVNMFKCVGSTGGGEMGLTTAALLHTTYRKKKHGRNLPVTELATNSYLLVL